MLGVHTATKDWLRLYIGQLGAWTLLLHDNVSVLGMCMLHVQQPLAQECEQALAKCKLCMSLPADLS